MSKPRYLTKSKFKLGLECITKLYYTGKTKEYADQKNDDIFLQALAEGGYQTGALSLFEFCDDPWGDEIIVETLEYDKALSITNKIINNSERTVIAEAAFNFKNLFIRADIVVRDGSVINFYEVKAKGFNSIEEYENSFIVKKGKKERIKSEWVEYLYDVAFQKYVISKAYPNFIVKSHMILVDKTKKSTTNGLNQLFQIKKDNKRIYVDISTINKKDLGESILTIIPTDSIVDKIWNHFKVPTTIEREFNFFEFIEYCEEIYVNDKQVFSPLTMKCKNCSFKRKPGKDDNLKDGRLECWKQNTKFSEELLRNPWTIDVWQGRLDEAMKNGKYLIQQLVPSDLGKNTSTSAIGLNQYTRRVLQIQKVKNNDDTYYFDKSGFESEMSIWNWPLNFIDFETSMVALPFYKDKTPYNGVAFQWSHHVMYEDGKIEHIGQYINFEKGVFPNLEFIRTLKISLENNKGSIFRYHNHENTYLRLIFDQISSGEIVVGEEEKKELLEFINEITQFKIDKNNDSRGHRNMIDLYEIVEKYYYSPLSKGKIGLKFVLPAIINDSSFLKEKYNRRGIYGKALEINSLNFEDHQWINENFNNDPYKTLPSIFDEYDSDELDEYFGNLNGISDGGAAMIAYAYLQYTHIPEVIRIKLKDALLRYCELDTMAMCFLVEGMQSLEHKL
jgi:hypothetical protein